VSHMTAILALMFLVATELNFEQTQSVFLRAGYAIEQPFEAPRMTSFQVHDRERVLLAQVYRDSATAEQAHRRAQARESVEMNGRGPHLAPGFGTSVWINNVALAQASQKELDRLRAADIDQDLDWLAGSMSGPALNWQPVDADFVALLQDAIGVLSRQSSSVW
jgi:hypothetical protein